MTKLEDERAQLRKAERDIAEGEQRIAEQAELVERLSREGSDVSTAEALLVTLEGTLQAWRAHRDEIRRTIARLEAEGG